MTETDNENDSNNDYNEKEKNGTKTTEESATNSKQTIQNK